MTFLVGGWTNPFEKYAQVKLDHETPRIGVKVKKYISKTTTLSLAHFKLTYFPHCLAHVQ